MCSLVLVDRLVSLFTQCVDLELCSMYVNRHVNRRASLAALNDEQDPLETHRNDVKVTLGAAPELNTDNNPTQTPARITCTPPCDVFSGQPTQP